MSKTIEEAFVEFHAANPHVAQELAEMALKAKAEGANKLSIRMLWEVLRWRHKAYLKARDPSQWIFKLNDHYHSHYSRVLMEEWPELEGMFETRALRASGPNPLYDIPEPEPEPPANADPAALFDSTEPTLF